jgi:hypothetical protein
LFTQGFNHWGPSGREFLLYGFIVLQNTPRYKRHISASEKKENMRKMETQWITNTSAAGVSGMLKGEGLSSGRWLNDFALFINQAHTWGV